MSEFDEKVFDYLTRENNFTPAYEIYQLFPQVKARLIVEFWDLVQKHLKRNTDDSDWVVKADDDYTSTYSKMGVHLEQDPAANIRVIYEKLHGDTYYGVWINCKNESLNIRDWHNYVEKEIEKLDSMSSANEYWLGRSSLDDDFNNIQTLKNILPGKRTKLAKVYAKELLDFADLVKDDIYHMLEM